jgi:hypothetical protein
MIDMLTGPIISNDHMTGLNYIGFLQNGLPEQLGDIPLVTQIAIYFHYDGTPSHYT